MEKINLNTFYTDLYPSNQDKSNEYNKSQILTNIFKQAIIVSFNEYKDKKSCLRFPVIDNQSKELINTALGEIEKEDISTVLSSVPTDLDIQKGFIQILVEAAPLSKINVITSCCELNATKLKEIIIYLAKTKQNSKKLKEVFSELSELAFSRMLCEVSNSEFESFISDVPTAFIPYLLDELTERYTEECESTNSSLNPIKMILFKFLKNIFGKENQWVKLCEPRSKVLWDRDDIIEKFMAQSIIDKKFNHYSPESLLRIIHILCYFHSDFSYIKGDLSHNFIKALPDEKIKECFLFLLKWNNEELKETFDTGKAFEYFSNEICQQLIQHINFEDVKLLIERFTSFYGKVKKEDTSSSSIFYIFHSFSKGLLSGINWKMEKKGEFYIERQKQIIELLDLTAKYTEKSIAHAFEGIVMTCEFEILYDLDLEQLKWLLQEVLVFINSSNPLKEIICNHFIAPLRKRFVDMDFKDFSYFKFLLVDACGEWEGNKDDFWTPGRLIKITSTYSQDAFALIFENMNKNQQQLVTILVNIQHFLETKGSTNKDSSFRLLRYQSYKCLSRIELVDAIVENWVLLKEINSFFNVLHPFIFYLLDAKGLKSLKKLHKNCKEIDWSYQTNDRLTFIEAAVENNAGDEIISFLVDIARLNLNKILLEKIASN